MIRFMAIAAAFYSTIQIFSYLWDAGFFIVQQSSGNAGAGAFSFRSTAQVLIRLPSELAAAAILIGGILAARLRAAGRKTLLVGAVAYVI